MFDTHHHRTVQAPRYPQEIHEHRAPTDESIKLYREMETKARDALILALRVDSNEFKFSATVIEDFSQGFGLTLRIKFMLGEKTHDHSLELPDSWRSRSRQEWVLLIRDEIAKTIANDIMISLFHDSIVVKKMVGFACP